MVDLMKTRHMLLFALLLASLSTMMLNVKAESSSSNPANVEVGVWLVNVEKVDLLQVVTVWIFTCGLGLILLR
ncbi:MAG: hypothetical protein ACPLW5_05040 [Candidatus Bathyarchaeales archaeon]